MTTRSSLRKACARRSTRPRAPRADFHQAAFASREAGAAGKGRLMRWTLAAAVAAALACLPRVEAAEAPPLRLEAKIPLGDVSGRIDHMAVDLKRARLFVAEL